MNARQRGLWALADQALSSLTNFVLAIEVARTDIEDYRRRRERVRDLSHELKDRPSFMRHLLDK